jgi:hypothetical protein
MNRLKVSFIPAKKLTETLQGVLVWLEHDCSLVTTIRPENMHIFYTSLHIAVIATINSIRLIVHIPLKTESQAYSASNPITF